MTSISDVTIDSPTEATVKINVGATLIFHVTVTDGIGPFTYAWKNGVTILSTSGPTWDWTPTVGQTGEYSTIDCEVTDTGDSDNEVTSDNTIDATVVAAVIDNVDILCKKLGIPKTMTIDGLLKKFGIPKTEQIGILIKKLDKTKINSIDIIVKKYALYTMSLLNEGEPLGWDNIILQEILYDMWHSTYGVTRNSFIIGEPDVEYLRTAITTVLGVTWKAFVPCEPQALAMMILLLAYINDNYFPIPP